MKINKPLFRVMNIFRDIEVEPGKFIEHNFKIPNLVGEKAMFLLKIETRPKYKLKNKTLLFCTHCHRSQGRRKYFSVGFSVRNRGNRTVRVEALSLELVYY